MAPPTLSQLRASTRDRHTMKAGTVNIPRCCNTSICPVSCGKMASSVARSSVGPIDLLSSHTFVCQPMTRSLTTSVAVLASHRRVRSEGVTHTQQRRAPEGRLNHAARRALPYDRVSRKTESAKLQFLQSDLHACRCAVVLMQQRQKQGIRPLYARRAMHAPMQRFHNKHLPSCTVFIRRA